VFLRDRWDWVEADAQRFPLLPPSAMPEEKWNYERGHDQSPERHTNIHEPRCWATEHDHTTLWGKRSSLVY
jgi:hypothetical protein